MEEKWVGKRGKSSFVSFTCCCPSSCRLLLLFSLPFRAVNRIEVVDPRHSFAVGDTRRHCSQPNKNRVKIVYAARHRKAHTHARVWQAITDGWTDGWICRARVVYRPGQAACVLAGSKYLLNDTMQSAIGASWICNQPRARKSTKCIYVLVVLKQRRRSHLYLCEKGKQKWRARKSISSAFFYHHL